LLEEPSTSVRVQLLARGLEASEVLVRVVDEQTRAVAGASVEISGGAGSLLSGRPGGMVTQSSVTDEHGLARFFDPGSRALWSSPWLPTVARARLGSGCERKCCAERTRAASR
jgi:hypothetical protein